MSTGSRWQINFTKSATTHFFANCLSFPAYPWVRLIYQVPSHTLPAQRTTTYILIHVFYTQKKVTGILTLCKWCNVVFINKISVVDILACFCPLCIFSLYHVYTYSWPASQRPLLYTPQGHTSHMLAIQTKQEFI